MATWFDLPQEIKRMILVAASEVETVLYVPKDRRRKVDEQYDSLYHFSNLLTVSKNFVTPEEFAFAILSTAEVKLRSFNELRRLSNEAKPTTKQSIKQIHLSRWLSTNGEVRPLRSQFTDSFDNFTSTKTILSGFPELKQIFISLDDYCAEIGRYRWHFGRLVTPPANPISSEMIHCALAGDNSKVQLANFATYPQRLSTVIASFVRDRTRSNMSRSWIRPHGWIRRLIQFANEAGIEVIFNVNLCISSGQETYTNHDNSADLCWSSRDLHWIGRAEYFKSVHIPATMSTKDWLLRVTYKEHEYTVPQTTAYGMLHSSARQSLGWWANFWDTHTWSSPFGHGVIFGF